MLLRCDNLGMSHRILTLAVSVAAVCSVGAAEKSLISFKKTQLTDQFWSEGAAWGDFNKDGKKDIVYGPYWWAGPDFKVRHEYYPAKQTFQLKLGPMTTVTVPGFQGGLGKENAYADNFFAFSRDFNGDGWDDILILGFPGEASFWYENPKGAEGPWKKHLAIDVTDNESPQFVDITGDGVPEIVCSSKGFYGYAVPDKADPTKPFVWHSVSPNNKYHKFTHGLGIGDLNGDGKLDLLEKDGWWEQPASLAGDPVWKQHKFPFAPANGSAQMYVYDVNGDGRNDVITSLAAHGYGLAWYEQLAEKKDGEIQFAEHIIVNKEANENRYGVKFSQIHAIDLVDMDGDGLKDIVTGKRFWAHGPTGDAEPMADPVLYWFKLVRNADKSVDFVPNLIDKASGTGVEVKAGDINGDGLPDVLVGNKKGAFVFIQERKAVTETEWEKAQPKPIAK